MVATFNHDIVGLWNRVNRFIEEVALAGSAGSTQWNVHDVARIRSYLNAVRAYHDWVQSLPAPLDLPETHPRQYELRDAPAVPPIENESIDDAVRMMTVMRDELVNSASSRQASGLVGFDSVRLLAVVQKLENFLDFYVTTATPLDLPESSPIDSVPPAGRTGV